MNTTHQAVMATLEATKASGPFLTKRKVYFFGLLLPILVPIAGVGLVFYLPWLAIHCWRARRRATRDLILAAWKIPFQIAAFTYPQTVLFMIVAGICDGSAKSAIFEIRWTALLVIPAGALGLGLVYLLVGWVLLWATAKWPLDAKEHSPSLFKRR